MTGPMSLLDLGDAIRRSFVSGGARVWQFPTSSHRVVLLATLGHCRLALVLEDGAGGSRAHGSIDVGAGSFTLVASRRVSAIDGRDDGAELAARLVEIAAAHGAGLRSGRPGGLGRAPPLSSSRGIDASRSCHQVVTV
jgi:hypothetical protein